MDWLNERMSERNDEGWAFDPNDSEKLCDSLRGQTTMHAAPPRLEDEGQSGG